MEKIKEGNLSAMAVLFERYNRRLFNFFLKMGLKREISQDLTQNLFYRMIKYRRTYKSGAIVKTWIYQIARNLYNDYRREEKRDGDIFTEAGIYPADIAGEQEGYSENDYERLEMALTTLNDLQRELVVLSRYQGLKYGEISPIVNQSVPAIKVNIHRAMKQMRTVFFGQIKNS
ncbi:MAG: RNA polymerase sigma factor [Bacteroidota bacterium]